MILDDSLSAVDTDTEQKILRAMAERGEVSWLAVFEEAGYTGDHDWTVLE